MGRPAKPHPIEIFEDNIADADRLLMLVRVLQNKRARSMRRELRVAVGKALKVADRRHDDLDCAESDDAFVVFKPGGSAQREYFTEAGLKPLLRQAIVAIAAAVEAYVGAKACTFIAEALGSDPRPKRLHDIPLKLGDVLHIEDNYQRRVWGQRQLIAEHLEREASPDPAQVGKVFSTVGRRDVLRKVDTRRKVPPGTSEAQLRSLAERRNRIAHTGDRSGSGRAALVLDDAQIHLDNVRAIIEAMDKVL